MDSGTEWAVAGSCTPLPQYEMMPQPARAKTEAPGASLGLGGLAAFTLTLVCPIVFLHPGRHSPPSAAVPSYKAPVTVPAAVASRPAPLARAPAAPVLTAATAYEPESLLPAQPTEAPAAQPALVPFTLTQNDSGVGGAWAHAEPSQQWIWPNQLFGGFAQQRGTWRTFSTGRVVAAAHQAAASMRIVSWDPGQKLTYEFRAADGSVRLVSEPEAQPAPTNTVDWWQKHRADTMASIRNMAGVVDVRDVSAAPTGVATFEITYADGRKETRVMDPLVFDLVGKGAKTGNRRVLFDLYGTGRADEIQWMDDLDAGTGVLVFDPTGKSRPGKNGLEMFGDGTDLDGCGKPDGYANGFEALRALVLKAVQAGVLPEEVLNRGILDAAALLALEKTYGLKMKVGGLNRQAVSLAQVGIEEIALSQAPTRTIENFDGRANSLIVQRGAVFLRSDGTTGYYMNMLLEAKRGGLGLASDIGARLARR